MGAIEPRNHAGNALRRLRTAQALTGKELAEELGWPASKLSRVEQGKIAISVPDLATALSALGAPEEVRAELLASAASDDLGAWVVRTGGVARRQADVGGLEQRVDEIVEYNPLLIPAQLQSRAYARALAEASGADPDTLADARARRQALLAVEDGPRYRVLLDERAFLRWAGNAEVMVKQLDHLLARMRLPNIDVRLLPMGRRGGATTLALGAFVIYRFRPRPEGGEVGPIVLLEHHAVDTYLVTATDVAEYQKTFDNLWDEALDPAATVSWLESRHSEAEEGR